MHMRIAGAPSRRAVVGCLLLCTAAVRSLAFRVHASPWRASTALRVSTLRGGFRDRHLWPRLHEIAEKIPDGARVADIGCDHGLLAVLLAEQKPKARVIGIDRSDLAIQQASLNLHKHRLANVDALRVGEGLSVLSPKEVDTVVLAGVGAHTIFTVLTNQLGDRVFGLAPAHIRAFGLQELDRLGIKRLVMQPNPLHIVSVQLLRCAMLSHGWDYDQESIVRDGKFLYLTTSWIRAPTKPSKHQSISALQALLRSPLNGRYMRGESDDRERELYSLLFDRSVASLTHSILQCSVYGSPRDMSTQQETLDALTRIRQTMAQANVSQSNQTVT